MRSRLMYIELKTGHSDDGPAWIGKVTFSRTGRTAYFNDQGFKYWGRGEYRDVETGEDYWISGVKKNGQDRHWAGKGMVMVEESIVEEYLDFRGIAALDKNRYEIVSVAKTDIQRLNALANEIGTEDLDFMELKRKEPIDLTIEELEFLIPEYEEEIKVMKFNKALRTYERARLALIEELEKRT